jgi:hypothetical protein
MTVSNANIPFDHERTWCDKENQQSKPRTPDDNLEPLVLVEEQTFNRLRLKLKGIDESEYETVESRLFVSRTVFNTKGDCSLTDHSWRALKAISSKIRKIGG